MWPYLIKVIIAITVFFGVYRLLYRNDTFFALRRLILLAMVGLSVLYPLTDVSDYIRQNPTLTEAATVYADMLPSFETDEVAPLTESLFDWVHLLSICYWSVCAFLLFRLLIQLGRLIWLRLTAEAIRFEGITIYALSSDDAPFSFFDWIFLNPENHTQDEIREIIAHEQAHVQQHHTFDVVLSELFFILCWINPLVWLLRTEIRTNLEYLADNHVVESGFDPKSYQYHLLRLAHHPIRISLSNRLSVSPLKRRIVMMNKEQSPKIKLIAYSLVFPIALLLIGANSASTIAEVPAVVNEFLGHHKQIELKEVVIVGYNMEAFDKTKHKKVLLPLNPPINQPVPDKLAAAMFPGGDAAMMGFFAERLKYPLELARQGESGRVYCRFTVNPDGFITNQTILQSTSDLLSAEVLRVINEMPKWVASKNSLAGETIEYTIPVTFRIEFAAQTKETGSLSPIERTLKKTDPLFETQVTNPTGKSNVRFRSTNNEKPLIVVDGQITTLDVNSLTIPQDQIESMAVLKDEVALKQYGEQGRNGVVVITTKRDAQSKEVVNEPQKDKKMKVIGWTNSPTVDFDKTKTDPRIEISTLNSVDDPLFIVDGTEITKEELNKSIDPTLIDRMEVLKDESARKLYGERGRNGVILITLKKTSELTPQEEYLPKPMTKPVPHFPGGEEALLGYINQTVEYPTLAGSKLIHKRVWVSCIVLPNGALTDIKIERGVNPAFDQEALRVINSLPKWEVPKTNQQVKSVAYVIPVDFRPKKNS